MIKIFNEKFTTAPFQLNFAPLQNAAIMISQDGDQQLVAQLFFVRLPIDIEIRGISTGRAVLEHIPPIAISATADRHVIGNDIEYLTQPTLAQPRGKARMGLLAAEFVVHTMVVDDIVTVLTTRRSLQIRRAVDMGNAEAANIIGNLRRRVEAETGVQLQTICSDWNPSHPEVRHARPDIVSRPGLLEDVKW
jgi:hypothetical protein